MARFFRHRVLPVASVALLAASASAQMRFVPVDADNFWVISPTPGNGKSMAMSIIKGAGNGANDAGAAHEVWRMGPHKITDGIAADPALGGYKFVAQSNGAQDYALNHTIPAPSNVFGGSFHGGETAQTQTLWVDGATIDPSTFNGTGRVLEINRTSTITWSDGAAVSTTYYGKFSGNVFEQTFTLSGSATMYNTGTPAQSGYQTLGFVEPRFSQFSINDGASFAALSSGNNLISDATRKVIFRDPVSLDEVDIEFTVPDVTGLFILYTAGLYAKLYVPCPAGALGSRTITRKDAFRLAATAAPPALPFVDMFDGSSLNARWRLVNTNGAVTTSVAGGEWVITAQGNTNRWVHQLNYDPGTYQVDLDYLCDAASTAGILSIQRSDSGSNQGAIASTVTLNSATPATATLTVTIAPGQTPWVMIDQGVTAGRTLRVREMRVTKIG